MTREKIYIATEDHVIMDYCNEYKIKCILTGPAETAIDRIKLFSDTVEADSYVNVQGDEPLVHPKNIQTLIDYNKKYPERVVFGKSSANLEEFQDYSKAKWYAI